MKDGSSMTSPRFAMLGGLLDCDVGAQQADLFLNFVTQLFAQLIEDWRDGLRRDAGPMMVAPRAPGPAYANPNGGTRGKGHLRRCGASYRKLSVARNFRFRSWEILRTWPRFRRTWPRIRAQLWRYGLRIASGGSRFLSPCDFKELRVIKRARFTTSTLAASQHSLNSIARADR